LNKIVIPVILAVTISIAGIFAFVPIDEATTVHTTLLSSSAANTAHDLLQTISASSTQTTNIQGSQFNNVNSTYDRDLSSNATATCTSGDFLVYYTFSNATTSDDLVGNDYGLETQLGIDDPTDGTTFTDIVVSLLLGNVTSLSGTVSGTAGETITFFGNSSGMTSGESNFEDTGDLILTVVCQSTATPRMVP